MENVNKKYLPVLDRILKKNFPEYFKEIKGMNKEQRKSVQILTQKEINELHRRYKTEGDIGARDKLIYSQLRLAYYYALKYYQTNNKTNLEAEDVLGFANQILVEIIEEYDPYKQKSAEDGKFNKLPSFVRTWLNYRLHKKQKDFGLSIHLPHNQINDLTLQTRYYEAFNLRFGRKPYNGESFEITEKVSDENIKRRLTFDYDEKVIKFEYFLDNEWHFDRNRKITKYNKIMSGNQRTNDSKDEFFDLMEGDYDIPLDDNKSLLYDALKQAMEELTQREQESLRLCYKQNEPMHNIPTLLTPDYECKKEVNSLLVTSSNTIDIYLEKNGSKIHLTYNIIANHHCEKSQTIEQQHPEIEMLTHKFKNKQTNAGYDEFRFIVSDAENIKVIHKSCDGKKELECTYDGRVMSFEVMYKYGAIFATQTFLNNKRKLINKLRRELKYLKNIN